jgi:hypothetical protein
MSPQVYTAQCVGGPLDGLTITTRTPEGFLAADKEAGLAWIYKQQADGRFVVCTEHDDSLEYPYGTQTGQRRLVMGRAVDAALDPDALDVIAVPGVVDAEAI